MTPRTLLTIRRRLKLTQREFADAVGVAPNTVARWERGELGMRPSTKKLIALLARNSDLVARLRRKDD